MEAYRPRSKEETYIRSSSSGLNVLITAPTFGCNQFEAGSELPVEKGE
jgi:hypothetical protein